MFILLYFRNIGLASSGGGLAGAGFGGGLAVNNDGGLVGGVGFDANVNAT